jgi:hypothetical protein
MPTRRRGVSRLPAKRPILRCTTFRAPAGTPWASAVHPRGIAAVQTGMVIYVTDICA